MATAEEAERPSVREEVLSARCPKTLSKPWNRIESIDQSIKGAQTEQRLRETLNKNPRIESDHSVEVENPSISLSIYAFESLKISSLH
jgi:hypothetical protein